MAWKPFARGMVVAALVAGTVVVGAGEALAADTGYVKVDSPRGSAGNGATARVIMTRQSNTVITYGSSYLNDVCGSSGGDGLRAVARAYVKYANGGYGYGQWHQDARECGAAPIQSTWGNFNGGSRISLAGLQVCVADGSPDNLVKCEYTLIGV